jgi:hypothetical protein
MKSQILFADADSIVALRLRYATNQIWRIWPKTSQIERFSVSEIGRPFPLFTNAAMLPGSRNLLLSSAIPTRAFVRVNLEDNSVEDLQSLLRADDRIGSIVVVAEKTYVLTYTFPDFSGGGLFEFVAKPQNLCRVDKFSDRIHEPQFSALLRWEKGLVFATANGERLVFEEAGSLKICDFNFGNNIICWGTAANGALLAVALEGDDIQLLKVLPTGPIPVARWKQNNSPCQRILGCTLSCDNRVFIADEFAIYWRFETDNRWHTIL